MSVSKGGTATAKIHASSRRRGGAANDVGTTGRAGDGDYDPLASLPLPSDAVGFAVGGQGLVDAVGDPHQGQLAQGAEVAFPEVVGERGVDLLRRVDVAVRHA